MTEAPDLIEPVIGFRGWRIERGRLRSQVAGTEWVDGCLTSSCPRDPHAHTAPAPGCMCGIYAYHHAGDLEFTPGDACGVVSLWGRIEVHTSGMRAQHARIEVLAPPPRADERMERRVARIADRYGVDFVPLRQLHRVATRYGSPVPTELFPQRQRFIPPRGRPHFRFQIQGDDWRVWPWGWWTGEKKPSATIGDIYVLDEERARAVFARVPTRSRAKAERLLHRWAKKDGWKLEIAKPLQPLARPRVKPSGRVIVCLGCQRTAGLGWFSGMAFTSRRYHPTLCYDCGSRLLGVRRA